MNDTNRRVWDRNPVGEEASRCRVPSLVQRARIDAGKLCAYHSVPFDYSWKKRKWYCKSYAILVRIGDGNYVYAYQVGPESKKRRRLFQPVPSSVRLLRVILDLWMSWSIKAEGDSNSLSVMVFISVIIWMIID
jgi:hypothetical protein